MDHKEKNETFKTGKGDILVQGGKLVVKGRKPEKVGKGHQIFPGTFIIPNP